MTRRLMVAAWVLVSGLAVGQGYVTADNPGARAKADAIIAKMTLEEKIDYIGGTGFAVRAMPGVGLPAFEMSDGPYGVRSNQGFPSTTYAAGIGIAASWNRELAAKVGGGIGRDARARGIHYMLGPGVNIYRSPRNGRNFEYFGEDPFLAAEMTVGYITGMQREGVSATVKHFAGNNSEFLRHDSDTMVDEKTLREIYLPAFEAAVKRAHVGAIMDSYNLTNGQHMTQNGYLNTDVARKEWGFDGVMMSDWVATYDGVAAANGGLDLEMPTGAFMNRANLLPAVKDGRVSVATIDEKVRRILETAMRFGWMEGTQRDAMRSTYSLADQRVALDGARESMVLLKNEGGVLPLDKSRVKTVLVVGPDAYPGVPVGGGSAGVVPFHQVGALEGIGEVVGNGTTVFYDRGVPTLTEMARTTEFQTAERGGKPGVTVELFGNADLSGAAARTVTARGLEGEAVRWDSLMEDAKGAQVLGGGGRGSQRSRRFTGYYMAAEDGPYVVAMQTEGEGGGSRLMLDGKMLFDEFSQAREMQPHATLPLTKGWHKVVVEERSRSAVGGRMRVGIVSERMMVSERAKLLAAKADVVVVAAGFDHDSESEGADRTFALPYGQEELIRAMASANRKTIVALSSGGNVDPGEWLAQVPGYIEMWYPGEQGGRALAEILFGEVNPSGHLPATFEKRAEDNPTFANYYPAEGTNKVTYKEGLFVGYRGYEHSGVKPLFPFGYGLSYTTFKFANLSVKSAGTGSYAVSFDVTNTGKRAGAAVAQVYVSQTREEELPAKELKGFEKKMLQPGEKQRVSVTLDERAFSHYDVAGKAWKVVPGEYGVLVGESSEELGLKGTVVVR